MVGVMSINLVFVVVKLALFLSICLLSEENFRGDSTRILACYSCSAFFINNSFECSLLSIFVLGKKRISSWFTWID